MTEEPLEDDGSHSAPATITVYPPGSNGNVKPVATIHGPLTSLAHPEGIAIGPANLTPASSPMLATYDWSVNASPNLAAKPPPREVLERFMLAIETSTTSTLLPGGRPQKLRSYQFADLRHDGFMSLVGATALDGTSSCGAILINGRFAQSS